MCGNLARVAISIVLCIYRFAYLNIFMKYENSILVNLLSVGSVEKGGGTGANLCTAPLFRCCSPIDRSDDVVRIVLRSSNELVAHVDVEEPFGPLRQPPSIQICRRDVEVRTCRCAPSLIEQVEH